MLNPSQQREQREKLVREHMADENAHAFDKVLSTFPHPRYEIVPTGAVYDGLDAVKTYYADTRRAFPDQRNEILVLRHADDAVIVEFLLRGTHLGPLGAVPPTGNRFECRMIACFIFEGTTLVCERVYFDLATLLKQLLGTVSIKDPASILRAFKILRGLRRGFKEG